MAEQETAVSSMETVSVDNESEDNNTGNADRAAETCANFISWETGTIEPKDSGSGMGNVGKPGGLNGFEDPEGSDNFRDSKGSDDFRKSDRMNGAGEMGSMSGGMNSSSYHMAS